VIAAIVSLVSGSRGVLEIGPGPGALTGPLSHAVKSLTVVELDRRFVDVLSELAPGAKIVQSDVLKTDVRALLLELPEPRSIVSNMPYNITGPLLGKVTESRDLFRNAVLMMQKEVGERVLAKPGTPQRGALSVAMQLQFAITKVCDAKAGAFNPPPKVDSIVLEFAPRGQIDPKVVAVVHTGFTQPRKTLANNLADKYDRTKIGLPANIRPHQLTNEQWMDLAGRL
jgi:16S rRNA (adenine1518-N6/adenine1519-N6)-dimethyltransferase